MGAVASLGTGDFVWGMNTQYLLLPVPFVVDLPSFRRLKTPRDKPRFQQLGEVCLMNRRGQICKAAKLKGPRTSRWQSSPRNKMHCYASWFCRDEPENPPLLKKPAGINEQDNWPQQFVQTKIYDNKAVKIAIS